MECRFNVIGFYYTSKTFVPFTIDLELSYSKYRPIYHVKQVDEITIKQQLKSFSVDTFCVDPLTCLKGIYYISETFVPFAIDLSYSKYIYHVIQVDDLQ